MFVLSETEPILNLRFQQPLILPDDKNFAIGLIDFVAYNSVPNIDSTNNMLHINQHTFTLREGSYEIEDIKNNIEQQIKESNEIVKNVKDKVQHIDENFDVVSIKKNIVKKKEEDELISLYMNINKNTMKFEIKCNKNIHFDRLNSIAPILGFDRKKLAKNMLHVSDNPIKITKLNTICVECNLTMNSYKNNKIVHTLYTFSPRVPSGFKIIEKVNNIIYLPINTRYISEITLKVVDQDGNLLNFQNETITITLHLREI